MTFITKEIMEARARAYVDERVAASGGELPLTESQRMLCEKLMAGFACREVARELTNALSSIDR